MTTNPLPSDRHRLAAVIAQALAIADDLDLAMVGLSLNGALERLTGHGVALDASAAALH